MVLVGVLTNLSVCKCVKSVRKAPRGSAEDLCIYSSLGIIKTIRK